MFVFVYYVLSKKLWGYLRKFILKKETFMEFYSLYIYDWHRDIRGENDNSVINNLPDYWCQTHTAIQWQSRNEYSRLHFFFNKHLLNDFCGSGIALNVGDKASGNSAVVPCRGRRKVRAPLNTLYSIKYEKSHRKTPSPTHMGSEEVLSEAEP